MIHLTFDKEKRLCWEHNGFLYREGNFFDDCEGIEHMFKAHWIEIGGDRLNGGELNINFEYFTALDMGGLLKCTGVEKDGKAIAYLVMLAMSHPFKSDVKYAVSNALFVDPKYRGRFIGANLLKFTESFLKLKYNIDYIEIQGTSKVDLTNFLKRRGYELADITYVKKLESI